MDPTSAKKSATLPQSNDNQTMIMLFSFFVDNNQEDFNWSRVFYRWIDF